MGLELVRYQPEFSENCVALEQQCAQGKKFKMWFSRELYHQRSESYDSWEIWLLLDGSRVIATIAWAEKSLRVHATEEKSAYIYDTRVAPDYQRRGLARRLLEHINQRIEDRGILSRYYYTLDDNRAVQRIGDSVGANTYPGYSYWVWPVYREIGNLNREFEQSLTHSNDWGLSHKRAIGSPENWDFYSNPKQGGPLQGFRGSILAPQASCSLWSNHGILEEVIESVPFSIRAMGKLIEKWPLSLRKWPRIPSPRDKLKSQIVFDLAFENEIAVTDLVIHLNNRAFELGLDYLYFFVPTATKQRMRHLQRHVPSWASPWINFLLIYETPGKSAHALKAIYPDIRDV